MKRLTDIQLAWLKRCWRKCVGRTAYSARAVLTQKEITALIGRIMAVSLNKTAFTVEAREESLHRLVNSVACRYHRERLQLAKLGRGTLRINDVRQSKRDAGTTNGEWYELSHPVLGATMACDQSTVGLMLRRIRRNSVDPQASEV